MPDPMDVQAFGAYLLGSGPLANVTGIVAQEGSDDASAEPQYLTRPGAPSTFVQSILPATTFTVLFKTPDASDRATMLRVLDYPHTSEERTLRAYLGDPDAPTLCELPVAVDAIIQEAGDLRVAFRAGSAVWLAVEPTVLSDLHAASFSGNGAHVLENNGHVRAPATLKLSWTVQRSTFDPDYGWRYRRQIAIENDSDENWEDQPIPVDLADTAAWVTAGDALSSGNDVRVWFEGRDLARTLVNFNTKRTLVWFLVTIPAGASNTYDVMYGNPDADTPDTLSERSGTRQTYVAPDIDGFAGTATAGTVNDLTMAGAGQETDRWKGAYIVLTSGTGSVRQRRLSGNTATRFDFNRALASAAGAGTTFVIWKSGIVADGGRVTGGVSATTVQDTGHTIKWPLNAYEGATVTFENGTASPTVMTVLSNTADTLTFASSFSVNPSVTDSFKIDRMGVYSFMVDESIAETDQRGLYRINRFYSKPSRKWSNGDTIAGWQFATYLPDKDDYSIVHPYDTGSAGGHAENWWGTLRSRRRVRQNKTYKNEGNGDGLSIYSPFGFQSIYFDWRVKNINGVGKVVLSCIESGGEDWVDVYTYTTTQATLTAIAAQSKDLSLFDDPTRLYMGVLPAGASDDDAEIPSTAAATDEVEVRTSKALELYLVLSSFGSLTAASSRYVVGSKQTVYDLNASLRIGGGNDADAAAPYDLIRIGGSGHKLALLSTEELWITADPALGRNLFSVYDTLASEIDRGAAYAGRIYRYRQDADGNAIATQDTEFAPIPPAINLVGNGDFAENDVSMWTMTPGPGVTAAKSWVSSPSVGNGSAGAMQIDITVTPVGAWSIELVLPTIDVLPDHAYSFGFWRRATANGSSVDATLYAVWGGGASGDPDQDVGGAFAATNVWYHDADSNHTYYVPPGMVGVGDSVDAVDLRIVISGTGSYVGKVFIDRVTLGVPAVHVTEADMGTLVLDAVWREGFLS